MEKTEKSIRPTKQWPTIVGIFIHGRTCITLFMFEHSDFTIIMFEKRKDKKYMNKPTSCWPTTGASAIPLYLLESIFGLCLQESQFSNFQNKTYRVGYWFWYNKIIVQNKEKYSCTLICRGLLLPYIVKESP